jgi:hypothetical protein
LAGIVTETGTVATLVFEEKRLNVTPEGAWTERVRDRFCAPLPLTMDMLPGKKLAEPVTLTGTLALVYPVAVAVIVAVPKLTPVTVGVAAGVVWPWGMNTLEETRLTLDVSLLARLTVTPPDGAGMPNVTENGTCCPGGNVTLDAREIEPCIVTLVVASGMFGRLLAWSVAEPGPTAVTGTETLLKPALMVTDAGTVTAPVFEELRAMVMGDGATAERFSVRFCVPSIVIVTFCWTNPTVAVT